MTRSPEKSGDAFRTIREVADWLGVPTHVLRFWESKFDQIAPVKGAGGRRYYRPEDMRLLGGIKVMLHDDGLTIRAVSQRIEESGVESIMDLSPAPEAGDTAPPQRTRRVIRKGDDLPARSAEEARPKPDTAPSPPTEEPASGPPEAPSVAIAKDPATPPEEALPEQPDVPDLPDGSPAPGEPLDEAPAPTPSEVPLDRSPPVDPAIGHDSAPADPSEQDRHAPEPSADPLPDEPLPAETLLGDTLPDRPVDPSPAERPGIVTPPDMPADPGPHPGPQAAPDTVDPLSRARMLVLSVARGERDLSMLDRKRLRRIVRRYRALAEEIADDLVDDLADGAPD